MRYAYCDACSRLRLVVVKLAKAKPTSKKATKQAHFFRMHRLVSTEVPLHARVSFPYCPGSARPVDASSVRQT